MSLKVKNKFLESKDLEKNDHTIDQKRWIYYKDAVVVDISS